MKSMTCKQLGGPCELVLHGETADQVIKAQDKHLNEMVAGGDDTHQSALADMSARLPSVMLFSRSCWPAALRCVRTGSPIARAAR